jgi:DNA-binding NarL/FixJ family response regulator
MSIPEESRSARPPRYRRDAENSKRAAANPERLRGGHEKFARFRYQQLERWELEIFSFIGRGVSVTELASELHVSVKTIETHQMRMKRKLALHTAAELRQKLGNGWLDPR